LNRLKPFRMDCARKKRFQPRPAREGFRN
jgi:hypothetical protein